MATRSYRLIISCPDKVGIVAAVSNFIAGEGGLISEANHYLDPDTSWFFTRQVIDASTLPYDIDEFRRRFSAIAADFSMEWRVRDTDIQIGRAHV